VRGDLGAGGILRLLVRVLAMVALTWVVSGAGQVSAASFTAPAMSVGLQSLADSGAAQVPTYTTASTPTASRDTAPQAPLITSVGGVGLGILVNWAPGSAADGVTSYRLQAAPDDPPSTTSETCLRTVSSTAPGSDIRPLGC
jgi:hypothetical protein